MESEGANSRFVESIAGAGVRVDLKSISGPLLDVE